MPEMKRSWGPPKYPIRDPRRTQQQNGKVVNPPRALKFGGVGEASIINPEKRQPKTEGPDGKGPVSSR